MMMGRAMVFGAALLAGACASTPGRSAATVPLEIPEPPPRVAMDPVPAVIAETPSVPERPPATPASQTAKPAPPPPASTTAAPAPAAPPPTVATAEPPKTTTPPPELRPAGPAGRTPTAAQVRDRVSRARQKLALIDRRQLSAGKKTDYDSARRFLSQAEGAVNANNLLLAESSVEKVETLANGLQ
jgi:hypothetical protein